MGLSAQDIVLHNIRKSFGPNEVLRGIDLRISGGEFVGLMGPNGAGKSTLIKVLDGIHQPGAGEIRYGDRRVPSLAVLPEVGFIHQDLGLVDDLSISDNLRLGRPPLRLAGPLLDRRREREQADKALALVGLARPSDTLVADLSPAEKTLVAIARVLSRGAQVLFVDEATSTLPPADARRLIDALKLTASRGATVIMVTHKLSEVLDAASRVVLILDGEIAHDASSAGLDRAALVELLVQHEREGAAQDTGTAQRVARTGGEELLRMDGVAGARITDLDLVLRAGEVVGVTGLPGSGLHDLAYLAHGALKPTAGRVTRAAGATSGLVPPHRETQGGFLEQSVRENVTIASLRRWRSGSRLLRRAAEQEDAQAMVERLSVKPRHADATFGTLSGGNKQKVVFGRVLLGEPRIYVLCEPTRGVDVATRGEIYQLIHSIADDGGAVLVVTSDSEDLFAVCDRISVVDAGGLRPFISIEQTNPEQLEVFI